MCDTGTAFYSLWTDARTNSGEQLATAVCYHGRGAKSANPYTTGETFKANQPTENFIDLGGLGGLYAPHHSGRIAGHLPGLLRAVSGPSATSRRKDGPDRRRWSGPRKHAHKIAQPDRAAAAETLDAAQIADNIKKIICV